LESLKKKKKVYVGIAILVSIVEFHFLKTFPKSMASSFMSLSGFVFMFNAWNFYFSFK